jgi:hypothetical protein
VCLFPTSQFCAGRRDSFGPIWKSEPRDAREIWCPPLSPLIVIGRSYPELATFCSLYSVMSFSHGQSDHLSGYDLMIWRCVTVREVTAVRLGSFVLYALAASSFRLYLCPNQMSLVRKNWIDRLFYQLRCRTGMNAGIQAVS